MNFLLILGFIGFSVLIILDPEVMRGVTLEEYQNDYCSTANITDKNDPMSLVCNNKFKKEKFIWILLDGLAFDQLYMLPQREANSLSNFFRIKSKEYKQSGSLHESIFTGKFSRNYPAKKMAIDHLFKQTKLSNIPVVYKGSYFPVFYLLGREKNEVLDSYELRGPEGFALNGFCSSGVNNIYDGYPSSFRKDITDEATEHLLPGYDRKFIYDKLNEHYADNMKKMPFTFNRCILDILGDQMKSYAYYTMRIDHLNHSYDKHYIGTIFDVYTIETTVLGLHRWADEHPEYAIIVSSDHGGQPYNGQDNICNHGCDVEGNEAVLMIYTKELGDVKYKLPTRKIWVNDVAPTITQIIKGVNIPLEAQGIPREIGDDNTLRYTAVKSKEVQLIQYITKFSEKFPKMKKKMMNYIDKIKKNELYDKIKTIEQVEEFSNAEYYKAYMNYLENIQDKLFSDIAGKGKSSFLYIGSFYLIWLLLLIKVIYEYRAIQNIVKEDNKKSAIKTSDLILDLIVIALICEVIACFFLSKKKIEDVINIARIVELGVMALLSFFIMIKLPSIRCSQKSFAFWKKCMESVLPAIPRFTSRRRPWSPNRLTPGAVHTISRLSQTRLHTALGSTSRKLRNWVVWPKPLRPVFPKCVLRKPQPALRLASTPVARPSSASTNIVLTTRIPSTSWRLTTLRCARNRLNASTTSRLIATRPR